MLAIITARAGSKGLTGKNIRFLHGKPLLAWPIDAANASRYIDKVVVSTDSIEFAQIAREHGAEVPVLRPSELASDIAPSSGAIIHMLDQLAAQGDIYEYMVLLEPTSPLTEGSDIDAAIETLHFNRKYGDALVSIAKLTSTHPAFAVRVGHLGQITPFAADDFASLPRRQELDHLYVLDGSLYISTIDRFRETLSFCHDRTLSLIMPDYKSFEVDSILDFICIEAIISNYDLIRLGNST